MLKGHPTISILNNPKATCMIIMNSIAKTDNSKAISPKNNGVKQTSIDLKYEKTFKRIQGSRNDQYPFTGVQPEGCEFCTACVPWFTFCPTWGLG